jgi:hypothetical protein
MAPDPRSRTVRLVDVPLDLYRRAQQHTGDIIRELVLMADHERASGTSDGPAGGLARRASAQHAGRVHLEVEAEPAVDAAHARGDTAVTLTYRVDDGAAASSEAWSALLDELDELCRTGELLTVPAPADVALFSKWFCAEFVAQLRDGHPPCPWPHFERQARLDAAR